MRVPLVGIPQAPETGRTFAPLDATTYDKVARANERLGDTVTDIGAQGMDLATRIKSAIDGGARANAESERHVALAAAMDKFTDGSDPQNGDPSTFLPRWKEIQQQVMEAQNANPTIQKMGFREKLQYQNELKQWQAQSTQAVGHFATEKGLQIAESQYVNSAEQLLYTGKVDQAVSKMQEGMAKGAVSPQTGERFVREAPIKDQYNQGSILGQQDPIAAEKALQDESYLPLVRGKTRTQLQLTIHREAQIKLQENLRDVLEKVDDNPNDPGTQAMVHDMAIKGQITPQAEKRVFAGIDRTNLKEARDVASIASMQAHDHDFTVDADPEGTAREMKDNIAGLPPAMRKSVWNLIDNRLAQAKRHDAAEEKPVESQIYQLMKEDRDHGGAFIPLGQEEVKHWFKPNETVTAHYPGGLAGLRNMSDEEAEQTFGKGMTARKVIAAEQLNYAKKMESMQNWFRSRVEAGKNPTIEEANAYRMKLDQPDIMSAIGHVMTNPPALIPEAAKAHLLANPTLTKEFDEQFGDGAAAQVLKK